MKLRSIDIKKFYRFNDFKLDLTYPKGHVKEGQPLDKICFIGQSGTGKTSLLNLIKQSIKHSKNALERTVIKCEASFEYDFDQLKRVVHFKSETGSDIFEPNLVEYFREVGYTKKENGAAIPLIKEMFKEHYKNSAILIYYTA